MPDALSAVSPLDGRYAGKTGVLAEYASERALIRARVRVEVEYLLALAALDAVDLSLDDEARRELRGLYEGFTVADAERVKTIEVEGTGDRPATNHDVKAVEYFVADSAPADARPWVHFGLTSEDVNNLAERLLVRGAVEDVLLPALRDVQDELAELAREHRAVPMLARTHGQPATPTTFGKEMAVFAGRLARALGDVRRATDGLQGKLAGATGTYAAHEVAVPEVDWRAFAAAFVADLGFDVVEPVTQVNPNDDLAALFDALERVNGVLVDCARDCWRYVSDGYLAQATPEGETGSSTMPHKVNPIDFENGEGNLAKATSDLQFLGGYLVESRLQRDLSDSTVKRNVGGAFAYCLLGYRKLADGLRAVAPDEAAMRADLETHPAVLAEAVQTVLRRAGRPDAYEQVKAATRGRSVSLADLRDVVRDLDLPADAEDRLLALTPADYTGLAADLADPDTRDDAS